MHPKTAIRQGEPDLVVVEITEVFDLHDFHPREIPELVEAYLEAAQEKGITEVRIVHGRGKGVQRARVQALLERSSRVESFVDAPSERGGWGATIARLSNALGDALRWCARRFVARSPRRRGLATLRVRSRLTASVGFRRPVVEHGLEDLERVGVEAVGALEVDAQRKARTARCRR